MGRYCSVDQVAARYRKVTDVISYPTAVDSQYIYFAEAQLDQKLGPYFTVPFSSNNVTAMDLSIDLSYALVIKYDDPKKHKAIMDEFRMRTEALISGVDAMLTDSGDLLYATGAGSAAWSNTQNCGSAFGLGEDRFYTPSSDGCMG